MFMMALNDCVAAFQSLFLQKKAVFGKKKKIVKIIIKPSLTDSYRVMWIYLIMMYSRPKHNMYLNINKQHMTYFQTNCPMLSTLFQRRGFWQTRFLLQFVFVFFFCQDLDLLGFKVKSMQVGVPSSSYVFFIVGTFSS